MNRSSTALIAGALLVAGIVLATLVFGRRAGPAESQSEPVAQEIPSPVEAAPPPPIVATVPNRGPLSREDFQQRILAGEDRDREQAESNQAAWRKGFEMEPVDPAWAPSMERDIREIAASEQFDAVEAVPSALDVDCRTSVCRLKAQFHTSAEAQDWAEAFSLLTGARFTGGAMHIQPEQGGSWSLTLITAANRRNSQWQ